MAAIAFIGLGQMGSPMASNLLQQGHQLRVFDVNAEAVRHLVDKGATPAANPAQAAKDHYHVAEWRSGAQRVVR